MKLQEHITLTVTLNNTAHHHTSVSLYFVSHKQLGKRDVPDFDSAMSKIGPLKNLCSNKTCCHIF